MLLSFSDFFLLCDELVSAVVVFILFRKKKKNRLLLAVLNSIVFSILDLFFSLQFSYTCSISDALYQSSSVVVLLVYLVFF